MNNPYKIKYAINHAVHHWDEWAHGASDDENVAVFDDESEARAALNATAEAFGRENADKILPAAVVTAWSFGETDRIDAHDTHVFALRRCEIDDDDDLDAQFTIIADREFFVKI